jgi:GNAT superfamily N-acetyltransferase
MKTGTLQLGNASLHLGYPQIVPGDLRGFAREITEFYVPEEFRGKGEGTELLKDVCEQADQNKILLVLIADTLKLAMYYERFGFVAIQKEPMLMVRSPKSAEMVVH